MTVTEPGLVNLGQTLRATWPSFLPPLADSSFLDGVWAEVLEPTPTHIRSNFVFDREIVLNIPGLDAVALTIGAGGGGTRVPLEVDVAPALAVRLVGVPLGLRLSSDLLRPVRLVAGQPGRFELDPTRHSVDITLGSVTLGVDGDGNVTVTGGAALDLPPSMIGDSGVVVEASGITLHLDGTAPPPGKPAGWKGIHIGTAALHLPAELSDSVGTLSLTDAYIGNGGFSGTVAADFTPAKAATLFGMRVTLEHAGVSFVQNALVGSEIRGTMQLPFFDEPVDVTIALSLDGSFSVALRGGPNGLATLRKPGVLSFEIDSLGFAVDSGVFVAKLSGILRPEIPGPAWPGVKVDELSIDSRGNVKLEGGWLNLRDGYTLNLYGFQFEITKLGLGSGDNGGKWIGFSGGLKLVDGMQAGASVEGLRVTWYPDRPPSLTLNGVGVEFEVPEVLRFKGAVSYRDLPGGVHRFDGSIRLVLTTLDLEVDGQLVIGYDSDAGYAFFAIYLDAELPAGIPLWSTGLAIYGLAGLFALEMEPDKAPTEPWYGMGPGEGWYKKPQIGVTDLRKWRNQLGSLGLGGGVTIGTVADNGFTFAGRFLLAIVFPGPILFVEGKANLLKERSKLADDPMFRALAVLDGRAGTFLVGLDAKYAYALSGEVIEVSGSAEAFFDFVDPGRWHVYLGMKDPRDRRIRAEIFLHMFEANAYFMLDGSKLALGAYVDYSNSWTFGPVHAGLEAWIEGDAVISFKPVHFHGELWLHGKAEFSVFGFGFDIGADARVAADIFDPFSLKIELSAHLGLPWPLPDFDPKITIEWGPDKTPPPLPMPLKEMAVEHFKVTTCWPLPRTAAPVLLAPNYDSDSDGFLEPPVPALPATLSAGPPANAPVVPLDARPHVTFGRSVHDDALVGVNPQPPFPEATPDPGWEWIGDPARNEGPARMRTGLREVALERWSGNSWQAVARKGPGGNPGGVATLFGSWAPVPQLPAGDVSAGSPAPAANTKLWLWSRSAFDYTRHTTGKWEDSWLASHPDYPCIPVPPDEEICCDFRDLKAGTPMTSPWRCPDHPEFALAWDGQPGLRGDPGGTVLCFAPDDTVTLQLGRPVRSVRVFLEVGPEERESDGPHVVGYDRFGSEPHPVPVVDGTAELDGQDLIMVGIAGAGRSFCLHGFCVVVGLSDDDRVVRQQMGQHLSEETARWQDAGFVLQPYTLYRLRVVTTLETRDFGYDPGFNTVREQTEVAYFRTEGPPGTGRLSVPVDNAQPAEFASGLDDLTRYVTQTVPATVAPPGQRPLLPRPVFRAYDVGVEFGEDYVDLLYRSSGRDLGLYLYDNNNTPARDRFGRLFTTPNRWGRADTLHLSRSDQRWVETIDASTCATINRDDILRSRTLTVDGQVLAPDTLYSARLMPLLLHEDFDAYPLNATATGPNGALSGRGGGWVVEDVGTTEGPSRWVITQSGTPVTRYIEQQSNLWGGPDHRADPTNPGTILLRTGDPGIASTSPDHPANWTDYRLTAVLRALDDDGIGLVVRHQGPGDHYLFAMDRERSYRRLVRVAGGAYTVLASDGFTYELDSDMTVNVEVLKDRLRVFQDGELVFDVTDNTHLQGGIGLYCWANTAARFADVRVDDFRATAPVVYSFEFTTSRFTDFFSHLASASGESWAAPLADLAGVTAAVAAATSLGALPAAPTDAEARGYAALAAKALGPAVHDGPPRPQVFVLTSGGNAVGLLLRTAEPVDWSRTSLQVTHAAGTTPAFLPMHDGVPATAEAALVGWSSAPAQVVTPVAESVTVVLHEQLDPDGWRLDYRTLPTVEPPAAPDGTVLAQDPFVDIAQAAVTDDGVLFSPPLDDLTGFSVYDPLTVPLRVSKWQASNGTVTQTSLIGGVAAFVSPVSDPGTHLLGGDSGWRDYAFTVRLRTEATAGAFGVLFRYRDEANWYRLSLAPGSPYRRLVRCTGGVFTLLWQDTQPVAVGQDHDLRIEALGGRLRVSLDGTVLCDVVDVDHPAGQVGLYTFRCDTARFSGLGVVARGAHLPGWDVLDVGALVAPSAWVREAGALKQSAEIAGAAAATADPAAVGSYAITGDPGWTDVRVRVRLTLAASDAIGVALRWQGIDDHLVLVLDARTGTRSLLLTAGGTTRTVWSGAGLFPLDQWHDVEAEMIGTRLRVTVDAALLVDLHDPAPPAAGRVGLFVCGTGAASFADFSVTAASPSWQPYATLTGVGTVAAGRRVRVLAGREADSVEPPVTAELRRFQGFAPGDLAGVRLPDAGVDLRLVAPDGRVTSARRFPPDDAFTPAAMSVLRALDGTGLLLVAPDAAAAGGSLLAPGTYRLRWTYQRDNRAADPNSQVLRENGDSSAEAISMDVRI